MRLLQLDYRHINEENTAPKIRPRFGRGSDAGIVRFQGRPGLVADRRMKTGDDVLADGDVFSASAMGLLDGYHMDQTLPTDGEDTIATINCAQSP
jgi:hypothetical protein